MRSILFIAIAFLSLQVIADELARPGPHNKIGHTKQDPAEKKDTFFYKLFNDELDEAFSARAIPIPIPTPCPSGPVFASTPGVSISG